MGKLNLNAVLLGAIVSVFLGSVAADAAEEVVVQYRLTKQRTIHLLDGSAAD